MKPTTSLAALAAVSFLALAAACSSARRGEPLEGRFAPDSPEIHRGQVLFMEHCHKCHPGGEAGLGPALNNKPLPAFMIRMQVRQGLGAMPEIPEERLSDDDLDQLVDFLLAYRKHG